VARFQFIRRTVTSLGYNTFSVMMKRLRYPRNVGNNKDKE
jgi:hypothetical protein